MRNPKDISNQKLACIIEVLGQRMTDEGRPSIAKWCNLAAERLRAGSATLIGMDVLRQIASGPRNTLDRRLASSALTFIECIREEQQE